MPNTVTTNKNLLPISSGFKMTFKSAPNTAYFLQNFVLPSITNGETTVARPTVDAHFPGPKTTYDPLSVTMLVTEDMENYLEIFKWIVAGEKFDDITIHILDSKNRPNKMVTFKDAFPTNIGAITFNTQDPEITYAQVDVNFRYNYFTIE